MNVEQIRAETPGCTRRIHLNNAGSSLMPTPVLEAIKEHLDLEASIGGYEAAAESEAEIGRAYESVAAIVGAEPSNIALTENATASYIQALSAIPLEAGDVILTTRNDYVSNQIQFLSLQSRLGVDVVRAPDGPDGGVDVQAMADLVRLRHPKLVCVTHVPTNSGLVQDIVGIGAVCRSADTLYLVDACQSVGQMPISVEEVQCDFLSATARKFLRGPRGAGFLYVSDRVLERGLEPLFIDMRGADWIAQDRYRSVPDAKRFENWEFAWALVLGMGEAARYAGAIGLGQICDRVQSLAGKLRNRLRELPDTTVLDRGPDVCGIVSVGFSHHDPDLLMHALRERRINTTAQVRIYAVLDYDDKGLTASLRLSPHYFNTEAELDETVGVLQELLSARS